MSEFVSGGLFTLILGAFGFIYRVSEKKADKEDVTQLCEDLAHITDRVDKIYDHLIADKKERDKNDSSH